MRFWDEKRKSWQAGASFATPTHARQRQIRQEKPSIGMLAEDRCTIQLRLKDASAAAGPVDGNVSGALRGAEAEVQGQVVLAAAASAGFDLAGERLAAELDDHARADRSAVALAGALQTHLEVVVLRRLAALAEGIDPDLAAGDQVEEAVAVDVGEGCLIGSRGRYTGLLRHIGELPVAQVAVHHALVAVVDGGQEEVDEAVVIHVAGDGHGVTLLPAQLDRFAL